MKRLSFFDVKVKLEAGCEKKAYCELWIARGMENTPPIAEILWVKNGRGIVVCEFLVK